MALAVAVVGAMVGSFVNVVIDRVPVGQSLLRPGSHCPSCRRRLRPPELVPILSYVALRGRCRSCGAAIPWRVPAVEAGTAMLFSALWLLARPRTAGDALWLATSMAYSGVMVALFVIDLEHRRLPNAIVLPATAMALALAPVLAWLAPRYAHYGLLRLVAPWGAAGVPSLALAGQLAGGITAFAVVYVIWRATPQGMGAGDVKLAGFAGLVTGFPGALAAVFGSFIVGGMVGVALLASGRAGRKTAIPFAPFLIATTLVVMVFGDGLLAWYLGR